MSKNNQIPTWAKDLLLQNERVIWIHRIGGETKERSTLFMFISLITIAIFFYGVISSPFPEFFIFLIGAIFLFGPVFWESNKTTYIATNERIISLESKSNASPNSLFYDKIYSIKSTDNNIFIYDSPLNQYDKEKGKIITIKNVPNNSKIIDLLKKHWYPKSIYHQYILEVKYIAEMNNLELDEDLAHEKLVISIKGELEGMPIHFNLNNLYYPTTFKIEITCPNPEKNSLLIKDENSSHKLGKLLGMQDIDTNNEVFNQQYLLQSNNLTFFNHVLNQKMINDISEANRYLRGTFTIDEKRKKKKSKINSTEILDADMFDFYSDELTQDENHLSILKYEVENVVALTNTKLVMRKSLEVFKTMMNLSLGIKSYA